MPAILWLNSTISYEFTVSLSLADPNKLFQSKSKTRFHAIILSPSNQTNNQSRSSTQLCIVVIWETISQRPIFLETKEKQEQSSSLVLDLANSSSISQTSKNLLASKETSMKTTTLNLKCMDLMMVPFNTALQICKNHPSKRWKNNLNHLKDVKNLKNVKNNNRVSPRVKKLNAKQDSRQKTTSAAW